MPKALYTDQALTMSLWRNVVMGVWTGVATSERLDRIVSLHQNLGRTLPQGMAVLQVLSRPGVLPAVNQDVRRGWERVLGGLPPATLATAFALAGKGMWVASARQELRSLMPSTSRTPFEIHDNVAAAVAFLEKRAGLGAQGPLDSRELVAIIEKALAPAAGPMTPQPGAR